MQAEYALLFWVPFQQPPLFISHRNAPDAVKPQAQKISIYEDNMHATQHHQFVWEKKMTISGWKAYVHSEYNHHQQILLPEPSGTHRLSHGMYPGP